MLEGVKEAPARARGSVVDWWSRSRTFLAQVRNELERVTWPSRKEVYATTVVVILTSILFGVYLWGIDLVLSAIVSFVFSFVRCGMTDVSTKQWYIVHTYSGFEKKVSESLSQRVQAVRATKRNW